MHPNHWCRDRRSSTFPPQFKLERHPEHEVSFYSASHSMQTDRDGFIDTYALDIDAPGFGHANQNGSGASNDSSPPAFEDSKSDSHCRPPNTSILARDFSRDLLLLIFNYVLWGQLRDADSQGYIAHSVLPASTSNTLVQAPIILSKNYSPLFLSFVCQHWRSVCLSAPTHCPTCISTSGMDRFLSTTRVPERSAAVQIGLGYTCAASFLPDPVPYLSPTLSMRK